MAELHIIGQLTEVQSFEKQSGLFCKWILLIDDSWLVAEGKSEGQTQVDNPEIKSENSILNHPIDIHLVCRGIQGWPRIVVEVYSLDSYNRVSISGYGMFHVPMKPGFHRLECHTWRPYGTYIEELKRTFVGGGPQLISTEYIYSSSARCQLNTIPSGKVLFELGVIARNFESHGVLF